MTQMTNNDVAVKTTMIHEKLLQDNNMKKKIDNSNKTIEMVMMRDKTTQMML